MLHYGHTLHEQLLSFVEMLYNNTELFFKTLGKYVKFIRKKTSFVTPGFTHLLSSIIQHR